MVRFGQIVQGRRSAMDMSLNALSGRMGGSPGPSFLSKIESGSVSPTREVALRIADALDLPRDVVLNATGHASETQEVSALDALQQALYEQPPVMVSIPVWDNRGATGGKRPRMMRSKEDVRIIDLSSSENMPYVGEVMYSLERKPTDGVGVIAVVGGARSAWTFHGKYLTNGAGEKLDKDYVIEGVIIRVTSEVSFE